MFRNRRRRARPILRVPTPWRAQVKARRVCYRRSGEKSSSSVFVPNKLTSSSARARRLAHLEAWLEQRYTAQVRVRSLVRFRSLRSNRARYVSRRRQQDGRNMHTPTLNSLEFMGAIPPGVGRRWNVLHEAVPLTSAQKKLSARGLRSGRSSTFQTYERLKERLFVSLA